MRHPAGKARKDTRPGTRRHNRCVGWKPLMASAGCAARIRTLGKLCTSSALHVRARRTCLLCLANADEATEAQGSLGELAENQTASTRPPHLQACVSSALYSPNSGLMCTTGHRVRCGPGPIHLHSLKTSSYRVDSDCKVNVRVPKQRKSTRRVGRDWAGTPCTKHAELRLLPGFLLKPVSGFSMKSLPTPLTHLARPAGVGTGFSRHLIEVA